MDVTNNTGEETKYRVSSGGTPPGDPEERERGDKAGTNRLCVTPWRKLSKSGCDKHAPVPPSPWRVEFQVGGQTIAGVASQPTDQVKLVQVKGKYKVQVTKVKPPKPSKPETRPGPKPKETAKPST